MDRHYSSETGKQVVAETGEGLLAEVDLKWLMAGQGLWIDPTRLHCDPSYAARMLAQALASPSPALRQCAAQLQQKLG